MKRHIYAAIAASALTMGMTGGVIAADAEVLHGVSEAECAAAGGKIDMGVKDEVLNMAGACVVADKPSEPVAPEPEEPAEPENPAPENSSGSEKPAPENSSDSDKPAPHEPSASDRPEKPEEPGTIIPGATEAECKAKGGKILMHVKDPKTGLFGACVIAEKPKPSDPTEPTKPSEGSESPSSEASKTSTTTKSSTPTTTTKKVIVKKNNGGLAMTGVSLGGLIIAAAALVGAGIFLIRRRQKG